MRNILNYEQLEQIKGVCLPVVWLPRLCKRRVWPNQCCRAALNDVIMYAFWPMSVRHDSALPTLRFDCRPNRIRQQLQCHNCFVCYLLWPLCPATVTCTFLKFTNSATKMLWFWTKLALIDSKNVLYHMQMQKLIWIIWWCLAATFLFRLNFHEEGHLLFRQHFVISLLMFLDSSLPYILEFKLVVLLSNCGLCVWISKCF